MKRLFYSIVLLSVAVFLFGCTKEKANEDSNMKDIYVIAGNYDLHVSNSSGEIGFNVDILSKEKLKEEKLKIFVKDNVKCDFELEKVDIEELPYYVYQSYKKTDWKKMRELASDVSKEMEFTEYENKYLEQYNKMNKKKNFYYYKVLISFENTPIYGEEIIDSITVEYKNKKYDCNIGKIKLNGEANLPDSDSEDNSFYLLSGGMANVNADPNKDGNLHIPDIRYEVKDDVVIKNIKVYNNDSISFKRGVFCNSIDNIDTEFENDLILKRGDKGYISLTLNDSEFKSKLLYSANMFVDIEFEHNGKINHFCIPIQINSKLDPYESYANLVDDVDILSYYTEYYYYYKYE